MDYTIFSTMENGEQVFNIIDSIIFLLFAVAVLYLLIFAIKSLGKRHTAYPEADEYYKFVILYPAYKEDKVIINSVQDFLRQAYPRDKYDIIVIADQMKEKTIQELRNLSAKVITVTEKDSSKVYALQTAVNYIDNNHLQYDIVVVLDADNIVSPDFLTELNKAFYSGCSAVQTHRVAKNKNTNIAVLDAVSEEINNSIFREGHVRLGFSSSLIGSGMAFEYEIFQEYIHSSDSYGEDKQIEMHLLRENIYIEYLSDVYTYDEKVKKNNQFYKQRRRWLFSQFHNLFIGLPFLPRAIYENNWDYCNKMFQWMMPPRIILLGGIAILACIMSFMDWSLAIKWWILFAVLCLTLILAVPDYLVNRKLVKAILNIPFLFILMFLNFFRLRGASKEFIHTEHDE